MPSSIISSTIDETYPVAGQDNDSQGFRDNFTIIKDNFAYAKSEIEALQDDTAKTNLANVFSYNTQSQASYKELNHILATPNISADADVSFNTSNFHRLDIQGSGPYTLTCRNWPTEDGKYSEMVIALYASSGLTPDVTIASENSGASGSSQILTSRNNELVNSIDLDVGGSYTIIVPGTSDFTLVGAADNNAGTTFTATGTVTGTGIVKQNTWKNTATLTLPGVSTVHLVVKAWTYDKGANVFLQYLGSYSEI